MSTGQQLEAFSTTFGLVASLAIHLAALASLTSATTQYDFDFELKLPAEVEFGLTGEMAMAPAEEPPSARGSPDPRWAGDAQEAEDHAPPTIIDAGVPDAGADTAAPELPIASPTLSGPSRIPPGAQLALRVDLRRIRESALAPDVTSFLQGVPDWQLLLDGSGIDPVADLDRLLVATPNLERSRLVLAGQHRHGESFAPKSVQRLARSRGKTVRWRQRHGVATAPWHNLDQTRRTIALLSAQHFSISRRQDLERVLAMAMARELQDANKEGLVAASGPAALLSMGPDEAISLEIEGVHRFVLGNIKHIPIRLRLAVRETGRDEATLSVLATYATEDLARDASVYWKKVAAFYSQQLIMSLTGFGKTLREMDFAPEEERIRISFRLSADQIRFILSYAEGRLRGARGATNKGAAPRKKGP